jgi:hypothetical protein
MTAVPTARSADALLKRARAYVAAMEPAVSGSHGHAATFKVAIALLHGFDLAANEAWPVMLEYNARCLPPWSENELRHKFAQVDKVAHKKPRGHLMGEKAAGEKSQGSVAALASPVSASLRLPHKDTRGSGGAPPHRDQRNWREFDRAALHVEQRTGITVDAEWLWKRSPVDCRSMSAGHFLTHVLEPGDRVIAFNDERSQGQFIFWNHSEARRRGWYRLGERRGEAARFECGPEATPDEIRRARLGVWWLCQPVTGEWRANSEKWSRRSEGNVTAWRHMIVESDEEGIEQEWLNVLVQLPLRIVALYSSGGRSVHALVRVGLQSKAWWDELRDYLKPVLTRLGADRGVFSAIRLTRLPGCQREGAMGKDGRYHRYEEPRLQRILFLNPKAEWRPILDLPVLRSEPMWEEAYV